MPVREHGLAALWCFSQKKKEERSLVSPQWNETGDEGTVTTGT